MDFLLGDCLELLPALPDKSVDHTITDPPYWKTRNGWDTAFDIKLWWHEINRVTRYGVIMTAMLPFAAQIVMGNLCNFRYDYVWEKNNAKGHLNANRMPLRAHELILVFNQAKYFPQMSGGHRPVNSYTKHHDGSNYGATKTWSGGGRTTRYPRSVVRFDVVPNDGHGEKRYHPTQKPLALFEYLLLTHTAPGEIILDPFCGVGTTALAARKHQRNFICIERDPDTIEKAKKRLLEAASCTTP